MTGNFSASAAIVAYSDLGSFVAAATGTSTTIDFDSLTSGSLLTTVGDASFFLDDPDNSLIVRDTFPETLSAPNYIGDSGQIVPGEQLDDFQVVTIAFSNAKSAIGLWVQFNPQSLTNTGTLTLQEINDPLATEANVDRFNGVSLDPGFSFADRAYFIGLVDSTGMNTLTEVDLFVSDFGSIAYTFDNVISFQATAIPEPGSFLALALIGGGVVTYRRRRSK